VPTPAQWALFLGALLLALALFLAYGL